MHYVSDSFLVQFTLISHGHPLESRTCRDSLFESIGFCGVGFPSPMFILSSTFGKPSFILRWLRVDHIKCDRLSYYGDFVSITLNVTDCHMIHPDYNAFERASHPTWQSRVVPRAHGPSLRNLPIGWNYFIVTLFQFPTPCPIARRQH